MILILLMGGIFGFLGLSVLCPLAALSAYFVVQRKREGKLFSSLPSATAPLRIEIIIPAHNESVLIGATLTSIQQSIQYLGRHMETRSHPRMVVRVAADGCTDTTAQEARKFPDVSVSEFKEKSGKWTLIKTLVRDSGSDWILLVDSGTVWPANFLSVMLERIASRDRDILAIAPSYRPQSAGFLQRSLWSLETKLKRLEAICGGPISLHGATVGYKTQSLKKALTFLGNTHWLNDDVVIPLTLRTLYPDGVILYPVGEVQDAGVELLQLDLGRRRRLALGNLQWVRGLLPSCLRRNPVAGVVAGRRLFRVFWAYWFSMIVLGLALAFHFIVLPGIAALGVLMATSGSFRQFSGAALISFLAPLLILQADRQPLGVWK